MSVLLARMSVHHMHAMPMEASREPGITGGCQLYCGCWELNLGLLEEQLVL